MSKSNKGLALFELLREHQAAEREGSPPPWRPRDRKTEAGAVAAPLPRTAADGWTAAPKVDAADGLDSEPLPPVDEEAGREPLVSLAGERLVVSLSSRTGAVAVFAVIVVLVAAFSLGSRLGRSRGFRAGFDYARAAPTADAGDSIEAVRNQPPATHLVKGLLTGADPATGGTEISSPQRRSATASPWISGYTYIVAQEFTADAGAEEARRAAEFLARGGIKTEIVTLANGSVQLITTQGFNTKDATQKQQAGQLLDKVQALGGDYYASGGRYRLKGYFKTLKGDSW